ncbi:MAG: response regulator [Bacteroidetes bacterium]|nr:response regulator [Bacteroidota bacterium]
MEEKKRRILLVDDEELNVRFLSTFLTRKGFEIDVASNGNDALERISANMPDVVLLDAMMPGMDGFEVCRRLRENQATHLLPVIMVTALHSIEDEVRALESGADDFLPKPINNLELMARLRSLLRIKTLHDELREKKIELEEKNKALVELQSLRDSLTQMVVHDLKNPLTGIMGCSELLLTTSDNLSERQLSIMKKMDESASTILKMITDILDISRIEENKIKLRLEKFHIKEILEANANEFVFMMQKYKIESHIEVEAGTPDVAADKDMVHRIVGNLLHNAIKHSTSGGVITLSARGDTRNGRMYVSIKDTGEGIPPEYTEKIFEKFAQADLKKLGLKTDRGLGLTFCKLAVEAHGGKIWVDSQVGQGSNFQFFLPLHSTDRP